ncbi:hypothetical protein PFICI_10116 [Pestalotiopsis fici W106-1]|uniref:Zn(2)-C6 fungal-type domain-containing protein n=1 Tax=Pestalotiopsis fici (strain W106-1 / CGMCC3.15140) TaxID=1229662 RepID=W3WW65_PESFW|nr:uncharacterized protein PFICI_10116 [Pestalotiopsis fici W106-1]ETS78054.1 hypothetical protein PFICI_10116 [Pestalotiopsis fici W106-1]
MDVEQRHVKCDERRPTCGNCSATDRQCSFLSLYPARLPSSRATAALPLTTPPASSCSAASPAALSHEAPTPAINVVDTDAGQQIPGQVPRPQPCFDVRHLVLLHHLESYGTKSSNLMSWAGDDAAKFLFDAVFKTAVAEQFLMHALLAFSALHLSTQQSDDASKADYLQQAAELQTCALALFNATKHNVREENCMALFIFSSLTGLHTLFDAVASCTDSNRILDKTIHYLKLHRGVSAVTGQSWHILRHSGISRIMDAIEAGDQLYRQQLGDTDNECSKLSKLVHASTDKLGAGSFKACQEAVDVLHWVFGVRRTVPEPFPTHIILAWPIRISAEFIELLEQRQPIPLIILAHWAVLLYFDRDFWVFGDAGRQIVRPILGYLGSYWDEWLDLPRTILDQD